MPVKLTQLRKKTPEATGEVVLTHPSGFHAQPSIIFSSAARKFKAKVNLSLDDGKTWIDGKNIISVMSTRAPTGSKIKLQAKGVDAQKAVDSLVNLIKSDFQE